MAKRTVYDDLDLFEVSAVSVPAYPEAYASSDISNSLIKSLGGLNKMKQEIKKDDVVEEATEPKVEEVTEEKAKEVAEPEVKEVTEEKVEESTEKSEKVDVDSIKKDIMKQIKDDLVKEISKEIKDELEVKKGLSDDKKSIDEVKEEVKFDKNDVNGSITKISKELAKTGLFSV